MGASLNGSTTIVGPTPELLEAGPLELLGLLGWALGAAELLELLELLPATGSELGEKDPFELLELQRAQLPELGRNAAQLGHCS